MTTTFINHGTPWTESIDSYRDGRIVVGPVPNALAAKDAKIAALEAELEEAKRAIIRSRERSSEIYGNYQEIIRERNAEIQKLGIQNRMLKTTKDPFHKYSQHEQDLILWAASDLSLGKRIEDLEAAVQELVRKHR